jgi:hypothetical protein
MSSFVQIRPVGAELFCVVGQKGMKRIVAFRNFANAPKIVLMYMKYGVRWPCNACVYVYKGVI